MSYKITPSTTLSARNMKIIHWGGTGTRKTESILRHYPDVLMIDIEGNAQQCVGNPAIPEFLLVQTKDVYEVMDILDDVIAGKIKFPDGRKVQTVGIDGMSVLWSVRQEVASDAAEARASKYKSSVNPDLLDISMREWNIAKRPMKELSTRLANLPIPFIVLTTREKDMNVQKPGSSRADDVIKVGVTMDAMKGLDYEANLAFRFFTDDSIEGSKLVKGPWKCQVTKVQGALGEELPMGKTLDRYPSEAIFKHAKMLKPAVGSDKSEVQVAKESAKRDGIEPTPAHVRNPHAPAKATAKAAEPKADAPAEFTKAMLIEYATQKGVEKAVLSAKLREANLNPDKWDPALEAQYKALVDQIANNHHEPVAA